MKSHQLGFLLSIVRRQSAGHPDGGCGDFIVTNKPGLWQHCCMLHKWRMKGMLTAS
jgi:hypothetical protein